MIVFLVSGFLRICIRKKFCSGLSGDKIIIQIRTRGTRIQNTATQEGVPIFKFLSLRIRIYKVDCHNFPSFLKS
jgi:hypothetical protein